jgi:hypothetical protein
MVYAIWRAPADVPFQVIKIALDTLTAAGLVPMDIEKEKRTGE